MDMLPSIALTLGPEKGVVLAILPNILTDYRDLFDKPLAESY